HHSLDMAVTLHDDIDGAAEMPVHCAFEDFLRGLVGRRNRVHQPDAHAFQLEQVRLAYAVIRVKPVLMAIEAFVAVAKRGDYRRYLGQFVEDPVHVHIAGMHHEIDATKYLEDAGGKMLARFGNVSIRNQTDAHCDTLRSRTAPEREETRLSWRR